MLGLKWGQVQVWAGWCWGEFQLWSICQHNAFWTDGDIIVLLGYFGSGCSLFLRDQTEIMEQHLLCWPCKMPFLWFLTRFDSLPRRTPQRPNRPRVCVLFPVWHCLWKCSRFLNIHRRTLTFPSKLFRRYLKIWVEGMKEKVFWLLIKHHIKAVVYWRTLITAERKKVCARCQFVYVSLRTLVSARDYDARSLFQCHSAILSLF